MYQLDRGLYILVRNNSDLAELKEKMINAKVQFLWEKPQSCPPELPLYCLHKEDLSEIASIVSCQQSIAGYGAFSLVILSRISFCIYNKILNETRE